PARSAASISWTYKKPLHGRTSVSRPTASSCSRSDMGGEPSALVRHDERHLSVPAELQWLHPALVERDLAEDLIRQLVVLGERQQPRQRRDDFAAQLERHRLLIERLDREPARVAVDDALIGETQLELDVADLERLGVHVVDEQRGSEPLSPAARLQRLELEQGHAQPGRLRLRQSRSDWRGAK